MSLMDLVKVTHIDCPIIIVEGVRASVYRRHSDIPLKHLWSSIKMIRALDNQVMVWVE